MPAKKLTSAFCDTVRPHAGRQISFPDRDVGGLELRVSGEGRKTWTYRYRTHSGRQGRMTLGVHSPQFGVREARTAARKMQVAVDEGGDPGMARRTAKVVAASELLKTFADLADAYFAATESRRYRPKRKTSLANERAVYRVHIERAIGRLPLEAVTRRMVKGALGRMLDSGVTSQAVRAQAVIRQMLTFAVSEERLPLNPIAGLPPVAPCRPRARVYSDGELTAIWTGVLAPETLRVPEPIAAKRRDGERVQIGPAMKLAIQLVFLLLQRRNEVLGMALPELDLRHGLWTIPAGRMKSKRPHAVPLSPWAIELIEAAITLNADRKTDLVFPGRNDPTRPMNGPSMNHALNTALWARGIDNGTIHDIRRTGSTLMTSERLGVSPFIRSKVLGHTDAGGGAQVTATHYDANSYVREKRAALEQWQRLLGTIVGAGASLNGDRVSSVRFDAVPAIAGGFSLHQVAMGRGVRPEPPLGPLFERVREPTPSLITLPAATIMVA
jgi:integrase